MFKVIDGVIQIDPNTFDLIKLEKYDRVAQKVNEDIRMFKGSARFNPDLGIPYQEYFELIKDRKSATEVLTILLYEKIVENKDVDPQSVLIFFGDIKGTEQQIEFYYKFKDEQGEIRDTLSLGGLI